LQKIRTDGITAKELKDRRAEFITEYYMSQQSNLAVAQRLYSALLETGDWHHALTVIKEMNAVKLDDVKTAMKKHLHDIYWVAVGDKNKMTRSDFLFH
jgi:predicted Zn-dependent peptidase